MDWVTTLLEVAVPVATLWADPAAPRPVDAAAIADSPDDAAWTAAMTPAQASTGLHGRSDTQLLLGEPVELLEERGDWVRIAARWQPQPGGPGYRGWVRRAHVSEPVPVSAGPTATVVRPGAAVSTRRGILPVSLGTVLWVESAIASEVAVRLPGGGRGRLGRADVAVTEKTDPPAFGPEEVLATARRLLGLRYLWGGTSSWGVDCSGLVHLAYRAQRVIVPRDAGDQAGWDGLVKVAADDVRAGDLYFFARPGRPVHHVGFATSAVTAGGGRPMLHAPEGRAVEDHPMSRDREATLVSAGRVSRAPLESWPPGSPAL